MDRPGAFFLPAGSALLESRTLEINPPAPPQEEDGPTLSLNLLVDNQPCDCIYISQAAIDEHNLPNTQAGWYFQLPDQAEGDERDEVPFSVTHSGRASKYQVLHTLDLWVDGQLANASIVREDILKSVKGFTYEERGMKQYRPFFLRKALFGEESAGGDDSSTSDDIAADTGTIKAKLYEAIPARGGTLASSSYNSTTSSDYKQNRIAPNKKVAFGIIKSVAPGPASTIGRWIPGNCRRGRELCELVVRYRPSTFFAPLRHRTNRQPIETIVISENEDEDGEDNDDDAGEGTLAKKRIKREHAATPNTTGEPLQAQSGVDTFLCRLCEKEDMKMEALKFLLMELNQRGLTTVGVMRQLTPDQWREILHNAHLPAKSLVPSIMELVAAPSSSSSSSSPSTSGGSSIDNTVVIVLD